MGLSRAGSWRSRDRSRSPLPFMPPSHFAAAGGFDYPVKKPAIEKENTKPLGSDSLDANHQISEVFMPISFEEKEKSFDSSFEFRKGVDQHFKAVPISKSPPSSSLPGSKAKRQSQLTNLPQLETQLLPSLRDTIDRMTRPLSQVMPTHLEQPKKTGRAKSVSPRPPQHSIFNNTTSVPSRAASPLPPFPSSAASSPVPPTPKSPASAQFQSAPSTPKQSMAQIPQKTPLKSALRMPSIRMISAAITAVENTPSPPTASTGSGPLKSVRSLLLKRKNSTSSSESAATSDYFSMAKPSTGVCIALLLSCDCTNQPRSLPRMPLPPFVSYATAL
jgi:hypothetical protein